MSGLLLYGDTERSSALRHEVPIPIGDPFLFAELDGKQYVLTSRLEEDRVRRALPDAELLDYFALGYKELAESGLSIAEASREVEARAVREIGIAEAIVPGNFPLALGDRLRDDGIVLTVDDAAVDLRRRAKTPAELDGIRAAQRAAEAGMASARDLLARDTARGRPPARGRRAAPRGRRPLGAASRLRRARGSLSAGRDRLVGVAGRWARARHGPTSGRTADPGRPLATGRGERVLVGHGAHLRRRRTT